MLHMKGSTVLVTGLLLIVAGCSILPDPGPSSTLTIAPPANPYQSTTKTPDALSPTAAPSTAQPILPTPTPFKHIIQSGDTLFGLALKYNISLDRLVSANPGLDSNSLIVGTEVIIPVAGEDPLPPTPTPYPVVHDAPICYETTAGGFWCYTLVVNNQGIPLENISLAYNIYNGDQELIRSQIAFPPLDILFPGQSIPVGLLIQDAQADQNLITTSLLTAYPSDQTDPQVLITEHSLEFSQENTIAQISGDFEIIEGEIAGDQIWIVAVGFSEGKPVGVRKWISAGEIAAGQTYPFEFTLYSLGPPIDQVELFSELH